MTGTITDETVVQSSGRQTTAGLGTGYAVLNLETKIYYTLSGTAGRVWELLREPVRVTDLIVRLGDQYDVDPERCHREVLTLLERLTAEGLIEARVTVDPGGSTDDHDRNSEGRG